MYSVQWYRKHDLMVECRKHDLMVEYRKHDLMVEYRKHDLMVGYRKHNLMVEYWSHSYFCECVSRPRIISRFSKTDREVMFSGHSCIKRYPGNNIYI